MTVRRLVNNDYRFGHGEADIISGLPEIMQNCKTTLMQLQGEWFLDGRDGVDWGSVLAHKQDLPALSAIIIKALMGVTGVLKVSDISVSMTGRDAYVSAVITTPQGQSNINQSFNSLELLRNDAIN